MANEQPWMFSCLGNEPRAYGPYQSESDAKQAIVTHCDYGIYVCDNGLELEEHDTIQLIPTPSIPNEGNYGNGEG